MKLKAYIAGFSGWLIPGFGHFIAGKYWRALILFSSITIMFFTGLFLHGSFFLKTGGNPLLLLAKLGNIGNGLYYFIVRQFELLRVDYTSSTYEYGTAFMAISGFLNFLSAMNAFDIVIGRKK